MKPVYLFLNIGHSLQAAGGLAAEGVALVFGLAAVELGVPHAKLALQSRQPFVRAAVKESAALLPVLLHNRLQLPPGVFVPFGRDGEFVGNEGAAPAAFGAIRRGFPPAVNVRSAQGGAAFEADVIMVGHGVSLCGGRLDLPKRGLPGTAIPCITAAGAALPNNLSNQSGGLQQKPFSLLPFGCPAKAMRILRPGISGR